jgi:hypothetical protein
MASLFSFFGGNSTPPAPPPLPQGQRDELGASGTINLKGFLHQLEYNRELTGKQGLKVWDRMRRSDASVREALWHIEMPIRNATWRCEPASTEASDLELCAFWETTLHEWLGGEPNDPDYQAAIAVTGAGFDTTLQQILSCLAYGHSVFEIVGKIVDGEMEYEHPDTGEPVQFSRGPIETWHKLAQRLPQTIWRWHQQNGDIYAIEQRVFKNDSYETIDIPGEDLMVFTLNREGDDFTGESILRPAYKAWLLKELVEKIMGVAAERFGVGIPIGYVPESAENDEVAQARLSTILAQLRAGAFAHVVVPGKKATSTDSDGYLIEILSPTGGFPDFDALLTYLRAEISAAVCARFSQLGHGKVGARATGDTQSKIWEDSLHVFARFIAGVLEQGLRRLSLKNFPPPRRWPRILVEDIEADNLEAFATANAALVTSQAIIADKQYRQYVRRVIDAPREADDTSGPADHGYQAATGVNLGPDGQPLPGTDSFTQVSDQRAEADAQRQQKYAPKPPPAS